MSAGLQYQTDIARQAVSFMADHGIAPTPENFELWTLYLDGVDEGLGKAVQQHLNSGYLIDDTFSETLYGQFLDRGNAAAFATEAESTASNTLNRIKEVLSKARLDRREYAASLGNGVQNLERSSDIKRIRSAIFDLIHANQKIERRSAHLEHELQATLSRIAGLNTNLERLKAETRVDTLSGLANRTHFGESLARLVGKSDGCQPRSLSVVMAEIDHFKALNDTWGHQVGDQVIRFVASVLKAEAGSDYVVCRYGGKEFAIIIPNVSSGEPGLYAETVRRKVCAKRLTRRSTKEKLSAITISLGVASHRNDESVEALVTRADANLCLSRRGGRNQVTF